jgi:hypothetical protein
MREKKMAMRNKNDELFDEQEDAEADELDRLTDLLFLRISDFADEEEVGDDVLGLLLLRLALTTRMMSYVVSVDKPSSFGLKLDLDRFRRDVDELVREMKHEAEAFIEQAKDAIVAARKEQDGS